VCHKISKDLYFDISYSQPPIITMHFKETGLQMQKGVFFCICFIHCNSQLDISEYVCVCVCVFKVCKSVHHRIIQINHQPDSTIFQFIILTFIYSSTCFGRSPTHHQELNDFSSSLRFYLLIVVIAMLCSWSGNTRVKPKAATVVIELLMMGGRMPETC